MSGFRRLACAAFYTSVAMLSVAGAHAAQSPYSQPTSGFVSVEGTQLLRDGRPWVPKGVILNALNAPRAHIFARSMAAYQANMATVANWGEAEINAIVAYGADTIRFNASEAGLDPQNPNYDQNYLHTLLEAIHLVRLRGLTVEVAMQWERPGGDPTLRGMPAENTVRAWQTILPYIGKDTGIILEAFNEPTMASNGNVTRKWLYGWGRRFQMLVTAMRAGGSQNLILLDGLAGGKLLSGPGWTVPAVNDPLNRLGYAIHAFPVSSQVRGRIDAVTPAEWDQNWGMFCNHAVCIVTAFYTGTRAHCFPEGNPSLPGSPEIAANLLAYLKRKHIGIMGFSFDYTRYLITNYKTHEPTHFSGFSDCDTSGKYYGVGWMLSHYFRTGQVVNERTGQVVEAP